MTQRSDLISEGYLELQKKLHGGTKPYGVSGRKYFKDVANLAEQYGIREILDYGCGQETLADALPMYKVTGYDPAIEGLDVCPEKADFVVCTDVMEHIEEDKIDQVLAHIRSLNPRIVYFSIALTPASKVLDDGRNAHVSLFPPIWWFNEIYAMFDNHYITKYYLIPMKDKVEGMVVMHLVRKEGHEHNATN